MPRLLVLVALMVTLAGCAAPAPAPPAVPGANTVPEAPTVAAVPEPAPQGPLTARVENLGYQVKFVLDGYTGATPPTVTIGSITGAVYADHAAATAEGVYILDSAERNLQVADQLTYTWNTTDGRTLAGEYLYTNPHNRLTWQITQTEHLVLFHAAPLEEGEAALLDAAARRSSELVGVPLPDAHLIVFLYPDAASLMDLYLDLDLGVMAPPTLSGFSGPGYIYIKGGVPIYEKAILVSHETVHALGSFHQIVILAEGLTQYTMMLEMAHEARTAGYESPRRKQFFDNLTRLTESVKIGGYNKVAFSNVAAFEPQDRNMYTIGCAFMLYVRSQYGDEGIRQLFSLYRQDATDMNVLSKFFGEPTAEVQRLFNIYLARGEALRDARTLFEFPE